MPVRNRTRMILTDRTRVAKSGNSLLGPQLTESDRKFIEIAAYTTV